MRLYIKSNRGTTITLDIHKSRVFDGNKVALTLGQGKKVWQHGGSEDVMHIFDRSEWIKLDGDPNTYCDYITLTDGELEDLLK